MNKKPTQIIESGGKALLADVSIPADSITSLLEELKADFDIQTGERAMWIVDVPNQLQQTIMVAQAGSITSKDSLVNGTIGVCRPVLNKGTIDPAEDEAGVYALSVVDHAASLYAHNPGENPSVMLEYETSEITVIEQPKHGKLGQGRYSGLNDLSYYPDATYSGNDKAEVLVKQGDHQIKVVYFFKVVHGADNAAFSRAFKKYCSPPGWWKIAAPVLLHNDQPSVTEGTGVLTALLTAATQSLTFADLTGSAVGQTTGSGPAAQITLDDNAAGHGWYIDYTPYLNEEYLPTSNPNEWIAREGSQAAGKMDLLSVLLHEYGHALGIGHSADSHDYMAATLQPGVRRLPSAAELGLMAELVGGVKAELTAEGGSDTNPGQPDRPLNPNLPIGTGLSALLLGRLRRSAYGSWSPAFDSVQIPAPVPQFDTAALTHTHLRKIEPGSFFPRFFPAPFSASFFPFSESCKSRQMRICMQPTPREVVSLNRANCATRHRPALRSA